MNNESTIEKMNMMKLFGMVRSFQSTMGAEVKKEFTADELLAHLIESEWDYRQNSKLNRLIGYARFRYQASMEEINFRLIRNLDKNKFLRYSDCNWIEKKQNIIVTGPTGIGKSFIACALGHQACMYGLRVLYFNSTKLFAALKLKKGDGTYAKELKRIQKQDLLIVDDFGLERFDHQSRMSFLEIMEDRHGVKSTLLTSQLPVPKWHEIIGDRTIADAICDRIIHSAHRIDIKGDSVRKKYAEKIDK